jgi:hypothetical protein
LIEATGTDNLLLSRLRKSLGETIEARIDGLLANPDPREAGYISGLRDALAEAENICREMNSPQPERH